MKICITYPPQATDLKVMVEKKINDVRKKYPALTSIEVKFIDDQNENEKVVQINAHVPEHQISIHKKSDLWEKATTSAFNSFNRQLKKIKEKVQGE